MCACPAAVAASSPWRAADDLCFALADTETALVLDDAPGARAGLARVERAASVALASRPHERSALGTAVSRARDAIAVGDGPSFAAANPCRFTRVFVAVLTTTDGASTYGRPRLIDRDSAMPARRVSPA